MNIAIQPNQTVTVYLNPSAPLVDTPVWTVLSGPIVPSVAGNGMTASFESSDPNAGRTTVAVSATDENNQVAGFILAVDVVTVPVPPPAANLNPGVQ